MKQGIHPEYREVCFVDLARGYHFPGDPRPFAILGVELPMHPHEPRPANT